MLSWAGMMLAMFMVAAIVGSVLGGAGSPQSPSALVALLAVVLTAALYAVFYISALFCFNDTFGGAAAAATPPGEGPLPPG